MYNRQEYSHNFALSDRCFSTCLLCYSSWRKFFSQTSMLHTYLLQSLWCFFKRLAHMFQETLPWHQLSREGGGIFIEWGSAGGPRDYLPKKTNIRYPHSGITGDAHSSYKVNPNCALCQKTSFFFSQFHVKSRDSSSNIFFFSISGHLYPLSDFFPHCSFY